MFTKNELIDLILDKIAENYVFVRKDTLKQLG